MIVPYTVDVPMERYPYANWALIAVTIVISVAIFFAPQPTTVSYLLPPELREMIEEKPAWYALVLQRDGFSFMQLFTCAFVHGDWFHLLGNMLFLFCFGNAINAKLGHLSFLGLYLFFAMLTSLAWLGLGEGPAAVGASGAIMGTVGAFLVLFPRNNVYVLYVFWFGYMVRAGSFAISSYWLILFYVAFDLYGFAAGGDDAGVAYSAHLAGAAAGVAVAATLLMTGVVRSTDTEQNLLQLLGMQYGDTTPASELLRRLYERVQSTRQVCGYNDGIMRADEWSICGGAEGSPNYERGRAAAMGVPNVTGGAGIR